MGSCTIDAGCNPSQNLICNITEQQPNTCNCPPYNYWKINTCVPQLKSGFGPCVSDGDCWSLSGLYCSGGVCNCLANYYWSGAINQCGKNENSLSCVKSLKLEQYNEI